MRLDEVAHTAKLDEFIQNNKEFEAIRLENESAKAVTKRRAEFMKQQIASCYSNGTKIFIDVRTRDVFGALWYEQLKLENKGKYDFLKKLIKKVAKGCKKKLGGN